MAVAHLEGLFSALDIEGDFLRVFSPRHGGFLMSQASPEPASKRAAWAVTNIWLLGRIAAATKSTTSLADAEAWFLGIQRPDLPSLASRVTSEVEARTMDALSRVRIDEDLVDLYPYVLESHGPGTRLSVMRNPATSVSREAKRGKGVFYTPSDVAEYMVEGVLKEHSGDGRSLSCLDPACGTGSFLRTQLRIVQRSSNDAQFHPIEYATECLYGLDLSVLAIESCAFVLLVECLRDLDVLGISPWAAWHALRLNLAAVDALRVVPSSPTVGEQDAVLIRESVKAQLLKSNLDHGGGQIAGSRLAGSEGPLEAGDASIPLPHLFPERSEGFDLLVGNPPYAELGARIDWPLLETEFASLRDCESLETCNTYPLFIECMWRLTREKQNASALVVPLSIAYHQGRQYRSCRRAMASHGGRWRCAFFDREPHALFGEEVKTRNAILFRRESSSDRQRTAIAEFETGPLRKWTSRTRSRLFTSIRFTPLGPASVTRGVPKLDGANQVEAFSRLYSASKALSGLWHRADRRSLQDVEEFQGPRTLFVSGTAYNFINVFRSLISRPDGSTPWSESGILALTCNSDDAADVVFAVLSSRLAYWLWRVRGDGFHVPQWFVETVPFGPGSFDSKAWSTLQEGGRLLWQAISVHPITSTNGGRLTVAYSPLQATAERDAIDAALVRSAGLHESFAGELRDFVRETVVVDENDEVRVRLMSTIRSGTT